MEFKTTCPPDKQADLMNLLQNQPRASDFLWSIFRCALESYKFDSLLRPFPKYFLNETGEKNIEALRAVAGSITSIMEIIKKLETGSASKDEIYLMHFILIQSRTFNLTTVNKTDLPKVMEYIQRLSSVPVPPHHIFAVDYSCRASNAKFESFALNYGIRHGFHGSRFENFYSILHHGLQVSLNKVAAFGPGVYLSEDLSVSMSFSPEGITWPGSMFGDKLAAIALCEMIDHPDVKCQDDKLLTRKYAEGNRSTEVPHKYFIVQNSDLVRVKYLLVYAASSTTRFGDAQSTNSNIIGFVFGFIILICCILKFFL